jgi:hypothetical protein
MTAITTSPASSSSLQNFDEGDSRLISVLAFDHEVRTPDDAGEFRLLPSELEA